MPANSGDQPTTSADQVPTGDGSAGVSRPHQILTAPRAWVNRNSAVYSQTALTNGRNPVAGTARPPSRFSRGPTTLTMPLQQSRLPHQSVHNSSSYDPSMGPYASALPADRKRQRNSTGYTSAGSSFRGVDNGVCKLSGLRKEDFQLGHIISLPYHTPNMDPTIDPANDDRWVSTVEGPAYSKRRMMYVSSILPLFPERVLTIYHFSRIVMWKYKREMFCLPLYSFGKKGLRSKPEWIKNEYICMMNVGDKDFDNQGKYPPVEAKCYNGRSLDSNTTVHITGGVKVAYDEDIRKSGRMERQSFDDLIEIWLTLSRDAQNEPW